jgi:mono/diheme cytochrome c family protein
MRILGGAALMLVVLLLGGIAFVYSGMYNVAASAGHYAPVRWLLDTTMHRSVATRAADVKVPPLDDPRLAARGAHAYDEMCVICHLKPGQSTTPLHQGLTPKPPKFAEKGSHMSAAENFWIIKHGIKMTGMPAWGETHSDEEIWALVAFVERLRQLSPDEYRQLVEQGGRQGGHRH